MNRLELVLFCLVSIPQNTALAGEGGGNPIPLDSLKSPSDSSIKTDPSVLKNEIQLEEIQIRGEAEKPSVIILPKRIEPEIEETGLDRSFSQEIKKNTDEVPKPDKAIRRIDPVKSIKKEIEKKRK